MTLKTLLAKDVNVIFQAVNGARDSFDTIDFFHSVALPPRQFLPILVCLLGVFVSPASEKKEKNYELGFLHWYEL